MDIILKIIRFIEIVSFILANIVVFLIFRQIFPKISYIGGFLLLLTSLFILKSNWIFYAIDWFREWQSRKEKRNKMEGSWKKISPIKALFIVIKLSFFNLLYNLFPIYIIWLGISIVIYLVLISFGYSITPPDDSIYAITATMGIILGVFQFIMQRHEDKILTQINMFSKRISNIIHQETNFDNFFESIPDDEDGKILKKWISSQVDPKLIFRDVLTALSDDNKAIKSLKRLMRRNNIVPFNVNVTYQESNKKFEIIESTAKMANKEKLLKTEYINFFDNHGLIDKILYKIEREMDIPEYGRLLLSNINLVDEVLPQLISLSLRQNVTRMVFELPEIEQTEKLNSRMYRDKLDKEVMDRLISQILK